MSRLSAWLDAHAAPQWRLAHRLWSIRVALAGAVVSGLWLALPAFQTLMPPVAYAGLCIAVALAICVARLTKQPGLPDA